MMINEKLLSNSFNIRKLTDNDIDTIYKLCSGNTIFYQYHPPFVTKESIAEDIKALPNSKSLDDKYYIGFFDGESLVAVMDLIIGYPKDDVAFIGFFMLDISMQGKGLGSNIINDCISYLKTCSIKKLRLGVDKGNPQSFNFWIKNHFVIDETCNGEYLVMERTI